MAIISGTRASDTLVGTEDGDILSPMGTDTPDVPDLVSGLNGADRYSMYYVNTVIIDDRGTDGAVDSIIGAKSMYQVTKTGIETFATIEHVGNDLLIHLPSKSWGIRDPYVAATDIRIIDQYGDGQIETITSGIVTYTLVTGDNGTAGADVMAGGASRDIFAAGGGDDWVFGNGGLDRLKLGAGNDTAFGGSGNDRIVGQKGDDRIFGEDGNDRLRGGLGDDQIDGGTGDDLIIGGAGDNDITTGAGNDTIVFVSRAGGPVSHDVIDDFDVASDQLDFSRMAIDIAELSFGQTAAGDATITWDSGLAGGPELTVELPGLSQADLLALF